MTYEIEAVARAICVAQNIHFVRGVGRGAFQGDV
jgi:hypothetical protein